MASISGVKKSVGVRDITVNTTVAANDVARLMYYLNCVLKSCGVDIVQDDLLDYKNYHQLTTRRQDLVFLAAYKYSPDELLDKTIFVDDDESICGQTQNVFLEISQDMQLFHAQEHVLIVGEQKRADKIMVFRESWLDEFYVNPMKRNVERLTRIVRIATSDHCEHCAGRAGKCACTECPRKGESQCSPTLKLTGFMSGLLESLNESMKESAEARQRHCAHCKGLDAACGCEHGCVKPGNGNCTTVHETVTCDWCATRKIVGVRYKCSTCENYDLCQKCYGKNAHEVTHRFYQINQVGSSLVLLEARMKEERQVPSRMPAPTQRSEAQISGGSSLRKAFFYEDMSIPELKSYLIQNGERVDDVFDKEGLCRKVWECFCDSVSAAELVEVMKGSGVDISGYRSISARRTAAKDAFRSKPVPRVTSGTSFRKDGYVTLCGLKTERLNGTKGTVSKPNVNGRVEVVLDGSAQVVLIKAENLRAVAELID